MPDPDGYNSLPEECLNTITVPGLPDHLLTLKEGMPVVITRNMNINGGICNGTRMIVKEVGRVYLKGILMTGPFRGRQIMLPQVKLHHKGSLRSGLSFYRYQLPVKAAHAMSTNKAQGQTFSRVGVYLNTDVFSHGQLYVALSRVSDVSNLLVVKPGDQKGVVNVVHKRMFKKDAKKSKLLNFCNGEHS
jgi:ATP-dependent DNA helicase PIF1